MRKPLFIYILIFLVLNSSAQQTGRMETDRPDQTESVFITKKKYLQTEVGFNIEKDNKLTTIIHPTVLWKYGVSKIFELRLITEMASTETPLIIPAGNKVLTGLLPIQIGGKIALWEEKGLLPKTALLFHSALGKVAGKNFKIDKWAPDFRFSMQHTLSDNAALGYNIGAEWDGFSSTPYWVYTIAPGFNMGKNWYGYFELFGAVRKGEQPQHSFDAGLAYYVNDNFKVDISSGFGITEVAQDWYAAAGFSIRFNTKK